MKYLTTASVTGLKADCWYEILCRIYERVLYCAAWRCKWIVIFCLTTASVTWDLKPFEVGLRGVKLQGLKYHFWFEYAFVSRVWLACSVPNQWCCKVTGYADSEWTVWSPMVISKSSSCFTCLLAQGQRKNVDCLLIASLVAVRTLENPPWSSIFALLIAGSSLGRALFLLLKNNKKQCIWMMWDRGTRRFSQSLDRVVGHLSRPRDWGKFFESEKWTPVQERWRMSRRVFGDLESSYLVDPASSHMLVSKIKPCMSKYKQVCTVKLRMAH